MMHRSCIAAGIETGHQWQNRKSIKEVSSLVNVIIQVAKSG